MENFPKVFIIILNYNGKDFIAKTLSSVFKLDYPNFRVLLVDNNSTDGSLELAKLNFSKAVFIKNNANLGFSSGNNVGIKYALEREADYVLLLNYDTEVRADFLTNLVASMKKDDKIGIGSPVILSKAVSRVWFSGGKIAWLKMKTWQEEEEREEDYFKSDYISGCSMIIKAEVFKKIGLLDEDYFLYWEDADFSLKARRAGFKLVVSAKSRIYHWEKSEETKENKIYWLVVSGLVFFKKNTPFWLKGWILFYLWARRLKNIFDVNFRKRNLARTVQKAYRDFDHVK